MKTNKLLWVDDEQNILKSYSRALREQPYEVITTTSPEEALSIISNQQIQVLISDFRMPKMNGVELLEIVKIKSPTTIRVILSGYADEAIIQDAIAKGTVAKYLLKPIDNKSICEEIEKFFEVYRNLAL